jgi:hypothetical protein
MILPEQQQAAAAAGIANVYFLVYRTDFSKTWLTLLVNGADDRTRTHGLCRGWQAIQSVRIGFVKCSDSLRIDACFVGTYPRFGLGLMLTSGGRDRSERAYSDFCGSILQLGRFWTGLIPIVRDFNSMRGRGTGFDSHRPLHKSR